MSSSQRFKLDSRFKILIDNGIVSHHRSMFVIVGDKGRDQVPILHSLLSRAAVRARPTVLWAYKNKLEMSSNQRKMKKQLQKKVAGGLLKPGEDDEFAQFLTGTDIEHCYYKDTHRILGRTYGMCVLQDVHARYRTESHRHVVGRFNERFLLSLARCKSCLVIDDKLNVLPISKASRNMVALPPKLGEGSLSAEQEELKRLKKDLMEERETLLVGSVVSLCVTLDQARAVLKFVEGIVDQSLRSTVVMTAARGRGKSAALGLGMACAVAYGYCNIYVTAPSPENLKTMFEFIAKGLVALKYEASTDYDVLVPKVGEHKGITIGVDVRRDRRQTIQYIHPSDAHKLGQAELVCIDEAAAIPLPLVKALLGPYLVFMSSTINGYEGTGRSLSLKLISSLREKSVASGSGGEVSVKKLSERIRERTHSRPAELGGRLLSELSLVESIRYRSNDPVERWLTALLCLDVTDVTRSSYTCVAPSRCELMHVNRDTLFSHHDVAEMFLKRLVFIYTASHYKNSPDDLQLLSDAPAHHIFVLVRPLEEEQDSAAKNAERSPEAQDPKPQEIPDVYCVIQVCLEGKISEESIREGLRQGVRSSGDLIPWIVCQQDDYFGKLSGARIVRIATHPDMQKMGYGKRAMELLQMYYENKIPVVADTVTQTATVVKPVDYESGSLLKEKIKPRKDLPPLLEGLGSRPPEKLNYIGVSYGLTPELLKFWKYVGMTPVYLCQPVSELTGENTCVMLKHLPQDNDTGEWPFAFFTDFRRRFVSLLSSDCFRSYRPQLALDLLHRRGASEPVQALTAAELLDTFSEHDIARLSKYADNMADYHLIFDLVPRLAELYFLKRLDIAPKAIQSALLLGLGLQHKTVEVLRSELIDSLSKTDLTVGQMLGLFNQLMRAAVKSLKAVLQRAVDVDSMPRQPFATECAPAPMQLDSVDLALEKKTNRIVSSDLRSKQDKPADLSTNQKRDSDLGSTSVANSCAEKKRKLSKVKNMDAQTNKKKKSKKEKRPKTNVNSDLE